MRHMTLASLALASLMACAPVGRARFGVVYVDRAPPADRVEVITTRPGPDYAWVTGYWRWEGGNYAWQSGHWERAPRAHARWVRGGWHHDRRGWYYSQGHWR